MSLHQLSAHLKALRGVGHKLDIQTVSPAIGPSAVPVGDDCAAIPDGHGGYLLFAIEGLLDEFVAAEPWFAGYCSVMVNVSDIYAMGGRPTAVVDAIWTRGADHAGPIWEGMSAAAAKYGVPIVGGHTNHRSTGEHLAVSIVGHAKHLLTSFDARPGDVLVAAIDLRGEWYGPYPYWNASTTAAGDRLRGDLDVLAALADDRLSAAGKDISMGGVVGTTTMLAECSGCGVTIDVDRIPRPSGVAIDKWLSAFPSFGFVLAVPPGHVPAVLARFAGREIAAGAVGTFDDSRHIRLTDSTGAVEPFWDLSQRPFIGFGPATA